VLRPDVTIPIARYYIETNNGKGPARLFYVSNVFSFEDTGKEAREKWQCGAELIGTSSTVADAELVLLAFEILKSLGIKDIELRLSHAGLVRAILSKFDVGQEEQHRLVDRVMDGDIQALVEARPELANVISPMLDVRGKSSNFLKNIMVMLGHDFTELQTPLNDFINLTENLDTLGVPYEIDIASGRGFEYYTGLIFQFWSGGKIVAGGGRYDALIPLLGGSNTPASGFALYIDALIELIEKPLASQQTVEKVIVKPQPEAESMRAAFGVINRLHDAGFITEFFSPERTTDQYQTKWLLETRETGWRYSLRNLVTGDNYEAATADEIVTWLKARSKQ
jgi:histidyl-tRNA synthetase